jgi:hypothetical protein
LQKDQDMTDEAELVLLVQRVIGANQDAAHSPAWIATAAMEEMQFPRSPHSLMYEACHRTLCQIASDILRGIANEVADDRQIDDDDPECMRRHAEALLAHAYLLKERHRNRSSPHTK